MYKDRLLIDQPLLRGIILALSLIVILAIAIMVAIGIGLLIRSVFTTIPGYLSSLLVLAITIVPIRAVIRWIVIGSNNQALTLGIGVSTLIVLALAGLVKWIVFPAGDMGDVAPALVALTMAVYSLVVLVYGAWEIRATG